MSLAMAAESTAMTFLERNGWKLEAALNAYFSSPEAQKARAPRVDDKKLNAFFEKYKGEPTSI